MVSAYRPASLAEALRIRAESGAVPLAGGTDGMARRRRHSGLAPRFERPVLFVAHLPELHGIFVENATLTIGAAVTLSELLADERVPGVLREAIAQMASPAIRNVATLGGNVCNASPAGDTLPALYCLDARLVLAGRWGERRVPIERFILGPGKTDLAGDELLRVVELPAARFDVAYYRKVGTRKANALAKLSFLGLAALQNGTVRDVRIAFGAVAPMVVRSTELEGALLGRTAADWPAVRSQWVEGYARLITPIDDQRSTADYRKSVALSLLTDFVEACFGQRV
jgi:xanthine dehydrogenase FAD-binding subunit